MVIPPLRMIRAIFGGYVPYDHPPISKIGGETEVDRRTSILPTLHQQPQLLAVLDGKVPLEAMSASLPSTWTCACGEINKLRREVCNNCFAEKTRSRVGWSCWCSWFGIVFVGAKGRYHGHCFFCVCVCRGNGSFRLLKKGLGNDFCHEKILVKCRVCGVPNSGSISKIGVSKRMRWSWTSTKLLGLMFDVKDLGKNCRISCLKWDPGDNRGEQPISIRLKYLLGLSTLRRKQSWKYWKWNMHPSKTSFLWDSFIYFPLPWEETWFGWMITHHLGCIIEWSAISGSRI